MTFRTDHPVYIAPQRRPNSKDDYILFLTCGVCYYLQEEGKRDWVAKDTLFCKRHWGNR